jgi:hypothetical protein
MIALVRSIRGICGILVMRLPHERFDDIPCRVPRPGRLWQRSGEPQFNTNSIQRDRR